MLPHYCDGQQHHQYVHHWTMLPGMGAGMSANYNYSSTDAFTVVAATDKDTVIIPVSPTVSAPNCGSHRAADGPSIDPTNFVTIHQFSDTGSNSATHDTPFS